MDDASTPTNSSSDQGKDWSSRPQARTVVQKPSSGEQLEIKVLSQAPPHPAAAGDVLTPPGLPFKRPYDFKGQSPQKVTMPIVLSAPPPRKKSLNSSSDSSIEGLDEPDLGGSGRDVRVRFEVSVGDEGVGEGEEVRISGNTSSLGKWDVFNSIKLQRSMENRSVWSALLEVPVERPIKYRYLVTRPVDSSDPEKGFRVISWETFLEPRRCVIKKPRGSEDLSAQAKTSEYGISEGGQGHTDAGWLVSTSELHLQLGTLGSAVSISGQSEESHYLIRVEAFSTKPGKTIECSPLVAKHLNRSGGDCVTFDPKEGACPYDPQTNLVVFTTESHDFQHTGFFIDVYRCDDTATPTAPAPLPPPSSKVARASLLPRQYLGRVSRGDLVLTLFSPELFPIGTLSLSYLLIHPTQDIPLVHSTKRSYSNYWKKHKRMLHIGHRGLGDSYSTELKPTVTENTISSLKMAGNHGADYVEFDVQLTKDHVPIVYHNFLVCTTLAREGFFSGELYAMQVKDLTLQQLQSLKLDHSSVMETKLAAPVDMGGTSSSTGSDPDSASEQWGGTRGIPYREQLPERKTFPTLKTLFQSLPKHIGFDIEIKYPLPQRNKEGKVVKDYSCFDINLYTDTILKVVYRHARGRKIMFTCFNPDICTVLRRKQHKYPVLFLTCGLSPEYDPSLDVRGHSVWDASMHARAHNLLGVVCNSHPLLSDHHLIEAVKKDLVLFTWGHENNDLKNIEAQSKEGVHAVIYDCINYFLKPQKNVFQLEAEEKKRRRSKESKS